MKCVHKALEKEKVFPKKIIKISKKNILSSFGFLSF